MLVVRAQGTPFEVGKAIGETAPELVARAVEQVCDFDRPNDEIEHRLARIRARLDETFPEVLEEADGLALGAGIRRTDALALSVASDLHGKLPGWCSLVAVPSSRGTLVGKNLDTTPGMGAVQVVERVERKGAHAFTHLTTAGAMWTDGGVNDAGLALVNSSIAAAGTDPGGVPDGILVREILARCANVGQAVTLVETLGVMTLGENVLLADAEGQVAIVETLPGGRAVRCGSPATACNHPLERRLEGLADAEDPIRSNSERRLGRLAGATECGREWTQDEVEGLLSEDGICQHGEASLWTVASIVASPAERRIWVAAGAPCQACFEAIDVRKEGEIRAT